MALYLKKELEESRSVVGVWQITETEEELRKLGSVPADEMEEISFIKSESLRKQRLAVRALLCELFGEKVYLSHHDIASRSLWRQSSSALHQFSFGQSSVIFSSGMCM